MLKYFLKNFKFFLPKKHPQKLLRKTQINFFFLTAWAAQMAQTEEFMLQNVTYRTTVHRTGINIIDKPGDKVYILFCFCTVLARQAFTSFVANFFHFVCDGFGQFLDVFLFFLTKAHEGATNVAHRLVNGKRVSE